VNDVIKWPGILKGQISYNFIKQIQTSINRYMLVSSCKLLINFYKRPALAKIVYEH